MIELSSAGGSRAVSQLGSRAYWLGQLEGASRVGSGVDGDDGWGRIESVYWQNRDVGG